MRPNILLICADMIAAKNLGCYNDPARLTPNVDRLAARGVLFEQAYCATTPCIPTRASAMTGLYAHTHGKMAHLKMELNPRPPLLPEVLSQNGYRSALVGKTHWWPPTDSLGCDEAFITIDNHLTPELGNDDAYVQFLREQSLFDYNAATWEQDKSMLEPDKLPVDCLKVHWTGDRACRLLEQFAADDEEQPFFLFCSFVEPHGPGSVQSDFLASFADVPLRPIIKQADGHHKPPTQRRAVAQWSKVAEAEIESYRRGVYASLNLVDQNIGKLCHTLDRLGLSESTIVLFFTDHGDLMFDHGCIEKTFLYDGAIHIPLVVAGPGIPSGERRPQLLSQIDLMPTILDLCSIEPSSFTLEGRSFRPILENPQHPWRELLFCEVEQSVHLRGLVKSSIAKMLRAVSWKYIYTLIDGHQVEEELYHLDDDPDELFNRAHLPEEQNRINEYREEILRWLIRTEVNRLHPVPQNHYPVPLVTNTFV